MKAKKPQLIKVGNHFININDVSRITKINRKECDDADSRILYVVHFISNPNLEYTCWVSKKDIDILIDQFEIIERS